MAGQINPNSYMPTEQPVKQESFRKLLRKLHFRQVLNFSFRFPQLLRNSDREQAEKHLKFMAGAQIMCAITGIALNIKLKSLYPQIITQPWPLRWLTRFGVFSLPILIGYQMVTKPQREKLNLLISSMHRRLIILGQNGSLDTYFTA